MIRPLGCAESARKRTGVVGPASPTVGGASVTAADPPRPAGFRVGDRVYDKRDKSQSPGTCIQVRRHTNGSPKWLVQWDREHLRTWTWEVDLRPLPPAAR